MMQTAALIAAIAFALLALAGIPALLAMARFGSESTRLVAELRERGGVLIDRAQIAVDGAQAAVDRAGRQLDRAESVSASMDELGAGMADLADQVGALAGFGRAIAHGPVGRAAALAYGVRRAVGLRRQARRTLPGTAESAWDSGRGVMDRPELNRPELNRHELNRRELDRHELNRRELNEGVSR